jgi:hypothetical protein
LTTAPTTPHTTPGEGTSLGGNTEGDRAVAVVEGPQPPTIIITDPSNLEEGTSVAPAPQTTGGEGQSWFMWLCPTWANPWAGDTKGDGAVAAAAVEGESNLDLERLEEGTLGDITTTPTVTKAKAGDGLPSCFRKVRH